MNWECGDSRTRVLSSLDHAILCSTTKQSANLFVEGSPKCGAYPSSCLLVGLFSIIFSVCIMAFPYPFISTCLMLYFVSCIISCIILAVGWHKSRMITTKHAYYLPPGLSPGQLRKMIKLQACFQGTKCHTNYLQGNRNHGTRTLTSMES